jgi:hypothetical protein
MPPLKKLTYDVAITDEVGGNRAPRLTGFGHTFTRKPVGKDDSATHQIALTEDEATSLRDDGYLVVEAKSAPPVPPAAAPKKPDSPPVASSPEVHVNSTGGAA